MIARAAPRLASSADIDSDAPDSGDGVADEERSAVGDETLAVESDADTVDGVLGELRRCTVSVVMESVDAGL